MSVFKKIVSRYQAIVLVIIPLIISNGCDQVDIINPTIIYKENVVVRAELIANKIFQGVLFTKTLPVGTTYTIDIAGLKDVEAYIKVNGSQVIPLHYSGDGLYKPYYDYKIEPGASYELFAKHLGDPIYSKTYVPGVPSVRSVIYRPDVYYLQGDVQANSSESYGAMWSYSGGPGEIIADDFYSIETLPSVVSAGDLTVRTQAIPEQYRGSGNIDMRVYAFDRAFQKYFESKGNGKPVEDSFIHGGDNIGWNVEGQNAIGLFIGYSIGDPIKPK